MRPMNWLTDTPSSSDDYISTRKITERVDELREQLTPRIVAGWNMPGYMPDNEPATFDNWDDAYEYIYDELVNYADTLDMDDSEDRDLANELEVEAKRIRELLTGDIEEYAKIHNGYGNTIGRFHYWINEDGTQGLDDDEKEELEKFEKLLEEIEGYGRGHRWKGNHYPDVLISESHFIDYCKQYADDIGATKSDLSWPYNHIDWDAAANELQQDCGSVDFDGVTFFYRNV